MDQHTPTPTPPSSLNTRPVGRPGWHTQPPAHTLYDTHPSPAAPALKYATTHARAQPLSRLTNQPPTSATFDACSSLIPIRLTIPCLSTHNNPPMVPYPQPPVPVPDDLLPLSIADLTPPHDLYNVPSPQERPPTQFYSPVYHMAPPTPPDLYGDPLHPMLPPHPSHIQDDSAEVEAAIITAIIAARGDPLPTPREQYANWPSSTDEPGPPPLANPRNTSHTHPVTEPQVLVQHTYPPLDEVGISGSTVFGLPLLPLRSPPRTSEAATPHRAWSHGGAHPSSSSSALGFQPAPSTSWGNGNNQNVLPLPPHVQPQYARLSEREAAAVEREAAALRASQSHSHTSQSDQAQQRNAWENNQTLAQVGQLPHHPGQSLPLIGHSRAGINFPSTVPTSRMHMDPTTTALFSSSSPNNDPAALPPPPSTTASTLTSRNPSRQVTGDSASTEMPIAIDPIAGCKRTAETAFAGDGMFDLSASEEDVDTVDQLMEESECGVEAEAEAGEGEHDSMPVFTLEDGRQPPPKKRKLNDACNTQNANRGINIRLPPPPSLAGSSRPPAAPTPEMILNQLDINPASPRPTVTAAASAAPIDVMPASANLPPPVPVFQRDPDAPPSYADWVRENQPDAEVERWMECTRRHLVYDPSVVPAPPDGFESGKDRRKDGEGGEGTSGQKDGEGGEGASGQKGGEGEGEGGVETKEEDTNESAGGSGKSKPYEINENTPPNVNEGLWCLFDYPQTVKPKYSYAFMARVAILGSPTRRLQLQDIYVMIEAKFPFYRDGNHVSWKNSIRHNLSTNKWFVKCERDMVHEPGYSAMWTVDTTSKGGPKKKRERLGRSRKGRAVLAAREAAENGIIPDPRIVALAIAMKTAPPVVPPGVPITGSAVPPPKLPPVQPNNTEKPPVRKKKAPTPVPIAPAPAPAPPPSLPPVPAPAPSSSASTPVAPPAPDPSGGVVETDTPMEVESAQPSGETDSLPAQTGSVPSIVTVNTNIPTSPLATIEIESAGSASPLPPRKGRVRSRAPRKKARTLVPLLTSTPLASTATATTRRSVTPPKVPTPPFATRRLSPQSQSQKSKTPPVFPRLSIFTQAAGSPSQSRHEPAAVPSPNQPPPATRPSSPSTTQVATTPVQLSTPRPSIAAPSDAEDKDKGGRKGFNQHLLQRLVEEKENPKKAAENKPVINRLFAVPATGTAPTPPTVHLTSTLLKASTPFGSAGMGAGFGGFALTKAASFGASGFGQGVDPVATLTPAPATGGFGGFRSGAGAGFAAFGKAGTGSGTAAIKFGFTRAAFSNQASTSSIKTSNVRGEGDDDNEESRDSDTDMGDDPAADMSVDIDLGTRSRDTTGDLRMFTATQPEGQHQSDAQTQEPGAVVPQSSSTTQTPVLNMTLTNASGPAHSAPVRPLPPPASSVQGLMTNVLLPTSLFCLDAKPKRRGSPSASSSGASSPSRPTRLIEQTIRKHVTLDPVTCVPKTVNLDQMVGELQTMRLVVHHNFLPRAPPVNEDYRRALEKLLKPRKRKRGEPRTVYRGAGDDDFRSVTESDDSETEVKY